MRDDIAVFSEGGRSQFSLFIFFSDYVPEINIICLLQKREIEHEEFLFL